MELETKLKWVKEAEDLTAEARATAEKCRDYNDNKQWTADEAATLEKRGQSAIVINRIKPKNDGLMGMEVTTRTACKAFPRTPKENHDADAATEAIRYVCSQNRYNDLRSAAFDNIVVEGTGGVEVIYSKGKVRINHIFWDRMIYDPRSRRKNFSDAKWLGQVVWMDYDDALGRYPGKEEILGGLMDSTAQTYDDKPQWADETRRRVKIIEMYYKEGGEVYYCAFTRSGELTPAMLSPYKNEDGEREWPYCFRSANVGREGDRYSPTKQLLGPQDEINKRRSKALHLNSVRQIRMEKGAVDDVRKVKRELARPDGVVETTPGMEFEVLKTGDMAAAQFNLLAEAKMEIDSVGFSAAVSGKLQGDQSGVALRNRQAAGQTELAPLFDGLKEMDLRVYRKVWNCIRQYWTDETWIRVTDDEQNIKFVGLNKKVTRGEMALRAAKAQGATDEDLIALQQQLMQDPGAMQVVSLENNVAELDVDLQLADAPDVPTVTVEEFQGLAEVIKSGAPPVLMEAMVMASSIPHKERVLKSLRGESEIPPKVKEQVAQMQEQMQQLQQENQKLQAGVAQEQAKLQLEQRKLEVDRQLQGSRMALERYVAGAKLDLQRSVAEAEFKLKAAESEQDIKLERQKAIAKHSLERGMRNVSKGADVDEGVEDAGDLLAEEAAKKEQKHQELLGASGQAAAAVQSIAQAQEQTNAMILELMKAQERTVLAIGDLAKAVTAKKKLKVNYKDGILVGGEVTYQ